MKKLFLTLILPVFLVLPMNEARASYDGNKLYEFCTAKEADYFFKRDVSWLFKWDR